MSSESDESSGVAAPATMDLLEAVVGGGAGNSPLFTPHPSLASHLGSGSNSHSGSSFKTHSNSSGVKVKRTRQRVDAGEPRNSYASIANFSSTRAGYQLIRGRNHSQSLFHQHLNSNSNDGQFSSSFNPSGNRSLSSPPNLKLLQQLTSGNISPKQLSGGNNDTNNNFGFKTNYSGLQEKDHRNMILLDEAVMQMCASATTANIPGQQFNMSNGESRNNGHGSDQEPDGEKIGLRSASSAASSTASNLSPEAASHLLRDILQTGRGKQQLEQALAGLTGKEGGSVTGEKSSLVGGHNTSSQCSDDFEEGEEEDEGEEEEMDENPRDDDADDESRDEPELALASSDPELAHKKEEAESSSKLADDEEDNGPEPSGEKQEGEEKPSAGSSVSSGSRCSSPSSNLDEEEDSQTGINESSQIEEGSETVTQDKTTTGGRSDPSCEVKRARVENIVSNMLQVTGPVTNGSNANESNEPTPVQVNGCKKRKLYQPQQTSKVTEEEDLIMSNDEDENLDDFDDEELDEDEDISSYPPSPKRQRQGDQSTLKSQSGLNFLQMMKESQANRSLTPVASDEDMDEGSRKSPISDRTTPTQMTQLNFAEIKQQALEKVTQAILNQRSPAGNNAWISALKSELVDNVAKAIELTFADFGRRNPLTMRKTQEPVRAPPKDMSLLTQMLESKSHGHNHHRHRSGLKQPSVRDDRKSHPRKESTPSNGHHHFDHGVKSHFPPPFPGFSPIAGFKNPFPFFPSMTHGHPNAPILPPSLAQHFSSIALQLQREQHEREALNSQNSENNRSRLEHSSRSERDLRDESPSNRSANNSSTGPVDTQSEALSLVVSPKRKRAKDSILNLLGRNSPTSNAAAPPAPPPPLVPVSLHTPAHHPGLNHGVPNGPFASGPAFPFPDPSRFPLFAAHRLGSRVEDAEERDELLRESAKQQQHANMAQVMSNAALACQHLKMLANQSRGSPDSMNGFSSSGIYTKMGSDNGADGSEASMNESSLYDPSLPLTSTLTPMHLRKAKLMFFYVRYPSSAVLKMFFPDIKFNKNNTAQLVKWFSNFREFYYIQMEKYARQAVSEGVASVEDIRVGPDSELLRVLNLHYNRNNHIDVPSHFRYVVEQTLKEFFKSVQEGKDSEQSWKKAIYKIIARMDDTVPEYFKSPTFLDQLE